MGMISFYSWQIRIFLVWLVHSWGLMSIFFRTTAMFIILRPLVRDTFSGEAARVPCVVLLTSLGTLELWHLVPFSLILPGHLLRFATPALP